MKLLVGIALLPVLVLAMYFYSKDVDKEPKKLLFKIFGFEIIFTLVIAIFLETYLGSKITISNEIEEMFYYIYVIGMVEEGTKLFSAYIFGIRSKYYNSYYDAIIYCVFAALGFAGIENILYVLEGGIITGILRAILSVPGHILYGALMGSFIGLATTNKRQGKKALTIVYALVGLMTVSVLHGLYDCTLSSGNMLSVIIILATEIILAIFLVRFINKISKIDSFEVDRKIYVGFVIKVLITTLASFIIIYATLQIFGTAYEYEDGKYSLGETLETNGLSLTINSYEILTPEEVNLPYANTAYVKDNGINYVKVNVTIKNNSSIDITNGKNIIFTIKERDSSGEYTNISEVIDGTYSSLVINANDEKTSDLYFAVESDINENSRLRLTFTDCINSLSCDSYMFNLVK